MKQSRTLKFQSSQTTSQTRAFRFHPLSLQPQFQLQLQLDLSPNTFNFFYQKATTESDFSQGIAPLSLQTWDYCALIA